MHPPSLASCSHEPRAPQISQVARDFRLAQSQNLDEIADANLVVRDEVKQAKPRTVGQGAKEQVEREMFLFNAHRDHNICLDRYVQAALASIYVDVRIYLQAREDQ